MRYAAPFGIALAMLFSGCSRDAASTPTATDAPATASALVTAEPTPSLPLPSPGHITVQQTAAAPSSSGTVAIALLQNGSAAASDITITFVGTSQNHKPDVHATAHIGAMAAGEIQAVTADLSIPADDIIATITATATAVGSVPSDGHLTATNPLFHGQQRLPSVTTTAHNPAASAVKAVIVAACFDALDHLIGGGDHAAMLAPGDTPLEFEVAVSDTPDHCSGFARPTA